MSFYAMNLTLMVITVFMLGWATVTDILKREIPIYSFGIVSLIAVILMFSCGYQAMLYEHLAYAVIMFILFYIEAKFFNGGGGDAIMAASLGLLIGRPVLWVVLSATTGVLVYMIVCKVLKKKTPSEIPVAPLLLAGYLGYAIIELFCV